MIPGLHDAGFALLDAAAARRAAADTSTKNAAVFQPSSFDRFLIPEGQKYTPDLLSRYLRSAALGQTQELDGFKDEMRARDPHLDAEIQKQTDYIVTASLDALPYPSFEQPKKGGRLTGDALIAEEVASFLFARYSSPDYRLDEALTALCDGEWKWTGGYEIAVEPDPTPGSFERVTRLTPLPSQRFSMDYMTQRLMFDPKGDYKFVPVDDLGPNGTAQLVVHQSDVSVPSPARRGVLRRCMNYWLIKQRGIVWWAEYVQNFGAPALMGFFDSAQDGARAILEKAFQDLGQGSKMVLPKGTEVQPLEIAMRLAGSTPHEQISDWCDRQNSRVVSGHDQSSGVRVDAGSKQSTETGDEQGLRRAQSRATRIARTLREWDAKPAVAREFGPEVADKFTSIIALHVERPKDLLGLSEAFKNFSDAGVSTIPTQEFHDLTGIRTPEEGEECLRPPARIAAGAFGQSPGEPGAADQTDALARILPFARAAVRAAASSSQDPADLLASLLSKAEKKVQGSGEEITKPVRDLIVAAIEEGATIQQIVVRVLHRQQQQLDAPGLQDLLAATIAEAALKGVEFEKKKKAKAKGAAS